MRGRNRPLAVIAVWTLVGVAALFSGCSDDNKTAAPTVTGTEFTSANMQQTAAVSASTVDMMYNIGAIFAGIAVQFQPQATAPAGPSPLAPIPLGASGLCLGGATVDNVTWNDVDDSGTPTAGDTITVDLQNCKPDPLDPTFSLSGTPNPAIRYTLANVSAAPPPFTFQGTLAINLTGTDSFGSTDIDGIMAAEASTVDFVTAGVTLGADNGTAANTQITISESGTQLAFGCFLVHLDFPNVNDPLIFSMWTRGITKMTVGSLSQIMQLGDYRDPFPKEHLDFALGVPDAGQLKLLSYDSRGSVPGLASCYGGPTTGATSQLVTALGGSAIRLDIFKNTTWTPPADNTVITDWFSLLD